MDNAARIVKVLRIVDTREFELLDERSVPVPGSGDERPCDRCGSLHVIHVYVALDNGQEAIIGTGCADSPSMEKEIRAAVSLDKTIRKNERLVAALEAELAALVRIRAEVEVLPLPEIVAEADCWFRMGDARVRASKGSPWDGPEVADFNDERRAALTRVWREKRMVERGVAPFRCETYYVRADLDAARRLLDKAKKKAAARAA